MINIRAFWKKVSPNILSRNPIRNTGLTRIIENTGWLVLDNILNIIAGMLVVAWVARYLGPTNYGMLNYAIAVLALIAPIIGLGLKDILIRSLVRHPGEEYVMLGTAFLLQLSISLVVLLIVGYLALFPPPGSELENHLLAIIAASYVVQVFNFTLTFWFESRIQSKYIVWSRNIALFVASGVRIGLILTAAPLTSFAAAFLLETIIFGIGLAVYYQLTGERLRKWSANIEQARLLLRDSWPLIISGLAIAVYVKIDQIMLGRMAGSEALGIYSAAVRLSELWYFIPTALASSFYPTIIRTRERSSREVYNKQMQVFFDVMAASAYVIVIPLIILAPLLIRVLFGEDYIEAGPILRVHIWSYLFVSLGVARQRWLMAENMTKFTMFATTLGAVINVSLNLLLIPKYEGLGSAWATLISYAVSAFLSTAFSLKLWPLLRQLSLSLLMPFRMQSLWISFREFNGQI